MAVRSSNPALNNKVFTVSVPPVATPSSGRRTTMSLDGVVQKSFLLLSILVLTGVVAWNVTPRVDGAVRIPGWTLLALLAGLGLALVTIFRPHLANRTATPYAVCEGVVLGVISAAYESRFDGIVMQAVGLTVGVFGLLLFLYASRIIRVTENLRMGIVAATGAVMVVYLVSFVVRIFGGDVGFIHEGGAIGILFSLAVVTIASLNLVLDFDFIEKGVEGGAPRALEWYAAFGLLVTLVWLYLELLRLLSKLRR